MHYANYHIEHSFSGKILASIIGLLGLFSFLLKPFKVRWYKTGLIIKLNKRLYKVYISSEGLKSVAKDYTKEQALEAYPHYEEMLKDYRQLYSSLEKVHFFNNDTTKDVSEKTLSNFYSLESGTRRTAFADINISTDKHLFEFASRLSLESLQANEV